MIIILINYISQIQSQTLRKTLQLSKEGMIKLKFQSQLEFRDHWYGFQKFETNFSIIKTFI